MLGGLMELCASYAEGCPSAPVARVEIGMWMKT